MMEENQIRLLRLVLMSLLFTLIITPGRSRFCLFQPVHKNVTLTPDYLATVRTALLEFIHKLLSFPRFTTLKLEQTTGFFPHIF